MANEVQTATSAENTATSSVKMFSEFLRYAASGFVLLIGIWAGVPTSIKDIKESMGMEHWPFLVLGPVLGLILYAVHRNTVAPLMYWLVLRKLSYVALLQAERWKKRHRGDPNTWALVREIDNWSALVDYLYASAWALLAARVLLQMYGQQVTPTASRSILLISAFLLVVAIIGDVQVIRAERSIILGEPLAANSGKG
jgi:hypothetical protein